MLYQIGFYAMLVVAGVGMYFSYDYGVTSTKADAQAAADKLTDTSVKIADMSSEKKETLKVVYRDVIKTVEVSRDPSECLDSRPPADIADRVRQLQSQ